jgi:hypothetical protein
LFKVIVKRDYALPGNFFVLQQFAPTFVQQSELAEALVALVAQHFSPAFSQHFVPVALLHSFLQFSSHLPSHFLQHSLSQVLSHLPSTFLQHSLASALAVCAVAIVHPALDAILHFDGSHFPAAKTLPETNSNADSMATTATPSTGCFNRIIPSFAKLNRRCQLGKAPNHSKKEHFSVQIWGPDRALAMIGSECVCSVPRRRSPS